MKVPPLAAAALAAALVTPLALGLNAAPDTGAAENVALPLKEKLGGLLFNDPRLSRPAGQSCASCHEPRAGFADPDRQIPTSEGVTPGLFGNRNSPPAAYAAFSPHFHFDAGEGLYFGGQFLDGRAATLEEQAKGPFLNPLEMANTSKQEVVDKVRRAEYAALFRQVYGPAALDDSESAYDRIADAIAAFEHTRSFNQFSSKYDAWLAGKATLTAQERRGLDVFEREDQGNCAACHPSRPADDGTPPLFSDFSYDNLGVPKNPANRFYTLAAMHNPAGLDFIDHGLGGFLGLPSEDGKFKVPSLRNIALTAPYMHNGYFTSLRAVVDFYNTRDVKQACAGDFVAEAEALKRHCWPKPEVADNVNSDELGKLGLSESEVDDLVAFMGTLSDGWTRGKDKP